MIINVLKGIAAFILIPPYVAFIMTPMIAFISVRNYITTGELSFFGELSRYRRGPNYTPNPHDTYTERYRKIEAGAFQQ